MGGVGGVVAQEGVGGWGGCPGWVGWVGWVPRVGMLSDGKHTEHLCFGLRRVKEAAGDKSQHENVNRGLSFRGLREVMRSHPWHTGSLPPIPGGGTPIYSLGVCRWVRESPTLY